MKVGSGNPSPSYNEERVTRPVKNASANRKNRVVDEGYNEDINPDNPMAARGFDHDRPIPHNPEEPPVFERIASVPATKSDNEDVGPLVECGSCGRKFQENSIAKHQKVCQKVFMSKRKKFDSKKARTGKEGGAMESKQSSSNNNKSGKSKAGNWRAKSDKLRKALCAAKGVTTNNGSSSNLHNNYNNGNEANNSGDAEDDDLVPCPYCKRRFNAPAAERHIPRCKETKARPAPLKKGSNNGAASALLRHSNSNPDLDQPPPPAKVLNPNRLNNNAVNRPPPPTVTISRHQKKALESRNVGNPDNKMGVWVSGKPASHR